MSNTSVPNEYEIVRICEFFWVCRTKLKLNGTGEICEKFTRTFHRNTNNARFAEACVSGSSMFKVLFAKLLTVSYRSSIGNGPSALVPDTDPCVDGLLELLTVEVAENVMVNRKFGTCKTQRRSVFRQSSNPKLVYRTQIATKHKSVRDEMRNPIKMSDDESLSGFHCGLSEMRTASKYGTFFNPMITFNASTTIESACQLRSIHYLLDDLMIELISSWLEQESPLKVNSQVTQTGRLIRGSDIAGQLVTCLNLPS
ncbi:hypothetical protein X801_01202 [Opisthorchis viverrini]|uniref:Uncharacterized protein n=1 Tax=Opisthorchis viverrini TaxID=6198 RepID=A0A1S8X8W6_OPIVI|nr:hypothetical protein X801_01202 [Opisthorchis viverrini]